VVKPVILDNYSVLAFWLWFRSQWSIRERPRDQLTWDRDQNFTRPRPRPKEWSRSSMPHWFRDLIIRRGLIEWWRTELLEFLCAWTKKQNELQARLGCSRSSSVLLRFTPVLDAPAARGNTDSNQVSITAIILRPASYH